MLFNKILERILAVEKKAINYDNISARIQKVPGLDPHSYFSRIKKFLERFRVYITSISKVAKNKVYE